MTAESCLSVLTLVFSSLLAAFPFFKKKKHTHTHTHTQNTIKYTVAVIQKTSVL